MVSSAHDLSDVALSDLESRGVSLMISVESMHDVDALLHAGAPACDDSAATCCAPCMQLRHWNAGRLAPPYVLEASPTQSRCHAVFGQRLRRQLWCRGIVCSAQTAPGVNRREHEPCGLPAVHRHWSL
jgi:hypothetical protein